MEYVVRVVKEIHMVHIGIHSIYGIHSATNGIHDIYGIHSIYGHS